MSQALARIENAIGQEGLARLAAMSNLQKMVMLNNLAGNFAGGGWSAAEAQRKLILDELRELAEDGVEKRNVHEVRDGIADVLVTVYGLVHRFGLPLPADYRNVDGYDYAGGWAQISLALSSLKLNAQAMSLAIDAQDEAGLTYAVGQVLHSTYVLAQVAGVDADADLHEVVLSNLTKFDRVGTEDVQLTVRKYLNLGVETVQIAAPHPFVEHEQLYVSRSSYDQVGKDGKNYPKGKWLKSHAFVEPEFEPLPLMAQVALEQVSQADIDAINEAPVLDETDVEGEFVVREVPSTGPLAGELEVGDRVAIDDDTIRVLD